MLFFQSTALVFGRGLAAVVFLAFAGTDGSTATGFGGGETTWDTGAAAVVGGGAAADAELGVAAIPTVPSPTTSNGAQ